MARISGQVVIGRPPSHQPARGTHSPRCCWKALIGEDMPGAHLSARDAMRIIETTAHVGRMEARSPAQHVNDAPHGPRIHMLVDPQSASVRQDDLDRFGSVRQFSPWRLLAVTCHAVRMQTDLHGLTTGEAAARLAAEGPNELPRVGQRRLPRILRDVLTEPMFALLIGSGVIYLFLGDALEALLLLLFASLSIGIAVMQEARSERMLDALRDLTSPRALVIRDGERRRIAGRDVVRGDLVVLSEGDRVPADGTLIEARELLTDESLLTGESVPVRKRAAENSSDAHAQPGGDDLPHVFSGTLVVRGQGLAEVRATGPKSEIGRIGQTLGEIETTPPHLTRQTARLVRLAAIGGLVCCLLVVLLYGLLRGSWLNALLAGIALGMSMLPEEFPLVLTVFMVMGAWRMSQARVLTRRAAAIETLGEATVLCTDKTGTLTENRMTVVALHAAGETLDPSSATKLAPAFRRLAVNGCAGQCAGCLRSHGSCIS